MAGLLSNRIGSEVPDPENTMGLLSTAIDATQPLLMLSAGPHRMRSGERAAFANDGAAGAPRKLLTRLPYAQPRSRSCEKSKSDMSGVKPRSVHPPST
jgi:hypothetical protein